MKNRVSLLTIAMSTMLSACMTVQNNSQLDFSRKEKLQKDIEEELDKLKNKNNNLQNENTNLQNENNNLTTENGQLKDENSQLKDKNKDLESKNEELEDKRKLIQALEDGDWKIIEGNGVDVEARNDLLGFTYKYDGKEITNEKTLADISVNKDITLEGDFKNMFRANSGNEAVVTDGDEIGKRIVALEFLKSNESANLDGENLNKIKLIFSGANAGTRFNDIFDTPEKKKQFDLILAYLKDNNTAKMTEGAKNAGKITYSYKEKNELTQGKKDLKLKYTDFGYWKQSFDTTGMDNALTNYLKDELKGKTLFFATGADHYKSDFDVAKVDKKLTFSGKTFASATKGDKVKPLNGDTTLSVEEGQATGKFDLNFENWYKFSLDKLKLGDFTADAGAKWKVDGSSTDSDFELNNGDKKVDAGVQIKGDFYGESGKLEEVAGTYKFKAKDSSNEIKVNGAFGAKKEK